MCGVLKPPPPLPFFTPASVDILKEKSELRLSFYFFFFFFFFELPSPDKSLSKPTNGEDFPLGGFPLIYSSASGESPRTLLRPFGVVGIAETRRHRSTAADLCRLFLVCLCSALLVATSARLLCRGSQPFQSRPETTWTMIRVRALVSGRAVLVTLRGVLGRWRAAAGRSGLGASWWLESFSSRFDRDAIALPREGAELLDGAYSRCEGGSNVGIRLSLTCGAVQRDTKLSAS